MALVDGIDIYEQTNRVSAGIVIEEYADLVKRIAQHMIARMPTSVQLDDLIQAGTIGLIEASKKYDVARGASFETYAGIRIRDAIVDEVRKGDWVPRSVHRNARRISQVIAELEAKLGREVKDTEVADAMGVTLDEYHSMSRDAVSGRLFSIEESFSGEEYNVSNSQSSGSAFLEPDESVQRDILKRSLMGAIDSLPERERLTLSLYYDEELNLKEIGKVLGVSESRVSQIHSQAALRLRAKLKDWQVE
ncbi:RNA polymerase sigma factor FliA [Candidatus Endobugula sertula]|uniref:RNA polymerase sigma factor FliA n=1 Tax=Candidatus Endobugula sertula TaxID=62101 RepID=A0A1D2QQ73_9GAMM|nr:RNA polymerase sigma factor FliA [Candidatus Endobugula sertula]